MKNTIVVCSLLSLLLATTAWADRPVSATVPADADGEVSIEAISGKIEVIGWDRDEVEVTGTIGDDVRELLVESDSGDVSIEVDIDDDDGRAKDIDARIEVRIPRGSSLEVESVSAGVSVEELGSEVSVESVSGRVTIRGSIREVSVESVSGGIEVVSATPLEDGEFESVSGEISLSAPLRSDGSFSFETVSGTIDLQLPADTSAEFEVETFSGRIDNELGPPARAESDHLPAKSLQFSIGGGGATVEIESFSGRIRIRQL